jgi:hypothetical protein
MEQHEQCDCVEQDNEQRRLDSLATLHIIMKASAVQIASQQRDRVEKCYVSGRGRMEESHDACIERLAHARDALFSTERHHAP